MRLGTWIGIGLLAIAGAGCGGGGGSKTPASYSDISASFAHPTGTVAATNADAVAKAYQTSLQSGLGSAAGRRLEQMSSAQTVSQACPNGGTISVDVGQANASAVSESFSYNNCCETVGCCLNGSGNLYYAGAGTATSSFCESFHITGTCSALPVAENFSYCSDGTTGTISYLVEVGGESFAVSGNYSSGNGTLTITGKNGTFTCTYTNDTGSCTGTGGTFAF
jgi:hypothetical protein